MARVTTAFDLTGKLLISTPAMGDSRFAQCVIYLCTHSAEGAFGFVLNCPISGLTLATVLQQLDIPATAALPDIPVLAGGPVETERGFVVFRAGESDAPDSERLADGLHLTSSPTVLADIARGAPPPAWFLALGYAGWGPGQLEAEIAANGWLICDGDHGLVFAGTPGAKAWHNALHTMGIDPSTLSAVAGHA